VTIMAGLAFATALTLIVVPVLYAIFFRVSFSAWAWRRRHIAGYRVDEWFNRTLGAAFS